MARALLPFYCFASPAAAVMIGRHLEAVAIKALKAILLNGKGLEVAHQQIRWGGHDLAFSSRVSKAGDLILELDIGDPSLAGRIVLESELRQHARQLQGLRAENRRWTAR